MKGKIDVYIREGSLRYRFTLKRNITVVRGDSAKGKSTLVRILEDYRDDMENSGRSSTVVDCICRVVTLDLDGWKYAQAFPEEYRDAIVVLDEHNKFIKSADFARFVERSKAYFVLITRNNLTQLSYSIDEVYRMIMKNNEHILEKIYPSENNFYINGFIRHKPSNILTEDSGAGYTFFNTLSIECIKGSGNSKIYNKLEKKSYDDLMIIGDGAAFGAHISKLGPLVKKRGYQLYLPESFEYLLYDKSIFGEGVSIIKSNTWDYAEGVSWERFYTEQLGIDLEDFNIKYNKHSLPDLFIDYISTILINNNLEFLIDDSDNIDCKSKNSSNTKNNSKVLPLNIDGIN